MNHSELCATASTSPFSPICVPGIYFSFSFSYYSYILILIIFFHCHFSFHFPLFRFLFSGRPKRTTDSVCPLRRRPTPGWEGPPPPKRSFPTPEQPLGRSARRAVSVLRFCWRSAVQWTSGLELGVGGFCLLGEPALGSNFSQWKASCEAGSNLTFMNDTCLHGHRGVP